MESTVFDSNQYARRLVEAGVSPENANLQAEAIGEVMLAVLKLDEKLTAHIAETRQTFTELRALIGAQDSELRALINVKDADLRALISVKDADLRTLIAVKDAELRALIAQNDSSQKLALAQSEKRLMRWVLLVGGALGVWQGLLAFAPRLLS